MSAPSGNDNDCDVRYDALDLSVRYHGASNGAPSAVPASAKTVVDTAAMFYKYLKTGEHENRR